MSVKDLIVNAHKGVFIDKNIGLLDTFWAEPYLQHNPGLPSGVQALRELLPQILPHADMTILRVLEDEDLIAFHQRVVIGDVALASFDVYRTLAGKIVEHWDVMQPDAGPTPSGRTMFDGATQIADEHLTDANRRLVSTLVETVLIAGKAGAAAALVSPAIAQHSPRMADGLQAFVASVDATLPARLRYLTLHRVIAEGNFVLTVSEAESAGQRHAVYDLWRLENAIVVEHWDTVQDVSPTSASGLTMF